MLSAARQIVLGGAVVITVSRIILTLSISIFITAVFSATSGCSMEMLQNLHSPHNWRPEAPAGEEVTGAEKVLCSTEELILAWDPPYSGITSYKIFYRSHESGSWILLDEIPADDDPEYILHHGDFGNGDYDFGVVSVDAETAESAMHTSLDDTAQPESGWYLSWEFCESD
jgi:hypothetical protein